MLEDNNPAVKYCTQTELLGEAGDKELVMDGKEGWRTIDTFYPFETMRVGLQNVVEAFCAVGYGKNTD